MDQQHYNKSSGELAIFLFRDVWITTAVLCYHPYHTRCRNQGRKFPEISGRFCQNFLRRLGPTWYIVEKYPPTFTISSWIFGIFTDVSHFFWDFYWCFPIYQWNFRWSMKSGAGRAWSQIFIVKIKALAMWASLLSLRYATLIYIYIYKYLI